MTFSEMLAKWLDENEAICAAQAVDGNVSYETWAAKGKVFVVESVKFGEAVTKIVYIPASASVPTADTIEALNAFIGKEDAVRPSYKVGC